jgi:hypothetical protein
MTQLERNVKNATTFLTTNEIILPTLIRQYHGNHVTGYILVKKTDAEGMCTFVQFHPTVRKGKDVILLKRYRDLGEPSEKVERFYVAPTEKIPGLVGLFQQEYYMGGESKYQESEEELKFFGLKD